MFVLLLLWNLFVFILFGVDKLNSSKKLTRIPEWSLLFFAFLYGGVGAMFGMTVFNNKTAKMKFRIFVPMCVLLNVLMLNVYYSNCFAELIGKIV